ncbi:MAG TPA: hypothetical protein VLB02_02625, partial [Candidatus Paceibacterota bacterium]|nr:hypothetical protein [Candidatus Paceibacterota bacterium]
MINLLPYNQKRALRRVLKLRVANATLVFFFFLVAVGLVLIIPSFISVNLRHRLASEQYAAIAESGSFASDEDLAATAAAIALLKSAYAADSTFSVLAALDAVVPPPGITITNISMASREGRSIEFSGISR